MGTTLTAVIVVGGRQLLIGHVGDSRAYLLHDGVLRRVTDDHSLVEELVREGRLTPEQAESHPQRAIVTRALGVDADVEVDLYTLEVARRRPRRCSAPTASPRWCATATSSASRAASPTRSAWPTLLVDAANRAGGEDNITVVVVDVLEVDAGDRARSRRCSPRPPRRRPRDGARARAAATRRPPPACPRDSWGAASAARCSCSCRSCSSSGSRSAASAGTRAARTSSASRGQPRS